MAMTARQFIARYRDFSRFLVALRSPVQSVVKLAIDSMQALTGADDVEVQQLILTGQNRGNADAANQRLFTLYGQIADAARKQAAVQQNISIASAQTRKGFVRV